MKRLIFVLLAGMLIASISGPVTAFGQLGVDSDLIQPLSGRTCGCVIDATVDGSDQEPTELQETCIQG